MNAACRRKPRMPPHGHPSWESTVCIRVLCFRVTEEINCSRKDRLVLNFTSCWPSGEREKHFWFFFWPRTLFHQNKRLFLWRGIVYPCGHLQRIFSHPVPYVFLMYSPCVFVDQMESPEIIN
uniref:Uncharacterized protein n=1 Tax=Micrurus spixii TaxID=129469 RepID=A0A2D4M0N6_9SAUR